MALRGINQGLGLLGSESGSQGRDWGPGSQRAGPGPRVEESLTPWRGGVYDQPSPTLCKASSQLFSPGGRPHLLSNPITSRPSRPRWSGRDSCAPGCEGKRGIFREAHSVQLPGSLLLWPIRDPASSFVLVHFVLLFLKRHPKMYTLRPPKPSSAPAEGSPPIPKAAHCMSCVLGASGSLRALGTSP